jgi:ZIP family zinc transporter
MHPTIVVLMFSSVAAGAAALGVIPLLGREEPPQLLLGWANALAAGLMLGLAYALTMVETSQGPWPWALGAVLGVVFIHLSHSAAGTGELDLNRLREADPSYGYRILLVHALHSGSEGLAIGAASASNLSLGVFVALATAVHNIPEAMVLGAVLKGQGLRLRDVAGLGVISNASLVLTAVATFAVLTAAPGYLPWVLGFAMGALLDLVLVELLPESYRQAGHTSIAVVSSATMVMVVLLQGVLG